MTSTLFILQIVLAILITTLVLLQKSSSIGLGAYSGSNESLFGAKGPAGFLTKATFILALLFVINTLVLGYMYSKENKKSAVDTIDKVVPAPKTAPKPFAPPAPATNSTPTKASASNKATNTNEDTAKKEQSKENATNTAKQQSTAKESNNKEATTNVDNQTPTNKETTTNTSNNTDSTTKESATNPTNNENETATKESDNKAKEATTNTQAKKDENTNSDANKNSVQAKSNTQSNTNSKKDELESKIKDILHTKSIKFATDSSFLDNSSIDTIKEIANILKKYPNVVVEIGGHTDNSGNEAANKKLSQERVDSVKKALVEFGVNEANLKAVGYGSSKPLVDNSTPENRAKNRRVEFRVIQK